MRNGLVGLVKLVELVELVKLGGLVKLVELVLGEMLIFVYENSAYILLSIYLIYAFSFMWSLSIISKISRIVFYHSDFLSRLWITMFLFRIKILWQCNSTASAP